MEICSFGIDFFFTNVKIFVDILFALWIATDRFSWFGSVCLVGLVGQFFILFMTFTAYGTN